jgi:NADH-quinone oxidoreductase subunit N
VFSLSALGLPPFSGFFGKVFVFRAALDAGLWGPAVAALVGSVVAAFYYLRLVKVIWFDASPGTTDKPPVEANAVALSTAVFAFPVVIVALAWLGPAAERAAHAFGLV